MSAFRWIEQEDQHESLAAALRSVLASRGRAVSYDELIALLGLGTLLTSSDEEPVEAWPYLARDGALVTACRLLGVQLRELHPPAAADGLRDSSEFSLHFTDSYLPLIEKALAVGQAVLAWRGWPPPHDHCWGVITRADASLIAGYTLGHQGEPVPLVGPAHQVYVIESVLTEAQTDRFEHLAHVAKALVDQQDRRWSRSSAACTGGEAMRVWLAACFRSANCEWEAEAKSAAARRALEIAVAQAASNRRSLVRWLDSRIKDAGIHRDAIAAWKGLLEQSLDPLSVARRVLSSRDANDLDGVRHAIAALAGSDICDRDAAALVRGLAASRPTPAGAHG